jgi:hypothetical protein
MSEPIDMVTGMDESDEEVSLNGDDDNGFSQVSPTPWTHSCATMPHTGLPGDMSTLSTLRPDICTMSGGELDCRASCSRGCRQTESASM